MDGATSVVQMVVSLVAVVAVILGLAWMTRRLQGLRTTSGSELRVKATLAVGLKERVVLIEASGRQFLIGVAPGRVNLLDALGSVAEVDADANRSPGVESREAKERGFPALDEQTTPGFTRATTAAAPSFREAFAQQLGALVRR